jgi:hypothetical protein
MAAEPSIVLLSAIDSLPTAIAFPESCRLGGQLFAAELGLGGQGVSPQIGFSAFLLMRVRGVDKPS